jgi:DNA repair photolyase
MRPNATARIRHGSDARPSPRLQCPESVGQYERMFYTRRMRVEYRLEPCKSALNPVRGMPFRWSLNPYMGCVHRCTFCYVRAFEQRADRPADDGYGRSIRVKTNVADVLARELARRTWTRDEVAVGTATDPYQPAEGRFRLTRACIKELAKAWTPLSIITRGPLVVRDIDVLLEASKRVDVSVTVSLPTIDEHVWRSTEPGTAPPRSRLEAVSRLAAAGVDVGVGLAPVLPGLSDRPGQLEEVVRAAKAAGARGVWAAPVHLRPGVREHFLDALARDWPEQVAAYEELFAERAYLPTAVATPIRERVREAARVTTLPERYRRTDHRAREVEPAQLRLAV